MYVRRSIVGIRDPFVLTEKHMGPNLSNTYNSDSALVV